jgi:integrase
MSIFKRGRIYWYKFMWNGEMFRESTRQTNQNIARDMESAHRTSLAKGEVGIREKKAAPRFADFCEKRLAPWLESTTAPKTWRDFYRVGLRAIANYRPLATPPVDQISNERAAEFAAHRRAQGAQVSTVNSSLRVLRRSLRLASEWGLLLTAPKIRMLPGELHREFVLSQQEEGLYLASAPEPLASVASVLAETGLRPEECYRLRWESITWANGRNGSLIVTHGKTTAARRSLPMTPRVRSTLRSRWESAGQPKEGWIWPALSRSGHIEPSSLKKQHSKALKLSGVRKFVLYSLRHTFLTRLGQSGCDTWTLARIAGHSSIAMSARYVHPSEDAVLVAVERLGGHNFGHRQEQLQLASNETSPHPVAKQDEEWWAVQDSNLRPPACKAGALTN